MPRVFVTGATGFIGRVVTEFAIQQGHTVRGLSRSEAGDALLTSLGATPVRGDLSTLDILSSESANADIVFHLAFNHSELATNMDKVLDMEVKAVDALAKPLVDTNKPLVVSSGVLLVQQSKDGKDTDETAPYFENPGFKRYLTEKNSLSWSERGVRVAVIRLAPFVFGRSNDTGFAATQIRLALKTGEAAYIGDGEAHLADLYVDDAARLYLLVAEKCKAGDIYNATKYRPTYKELAEAIGKLLDVPVKGISKEEAPKRFGPWLAHLFEMNCTGVSKKAVQTLGWNPVGPSLLEDVTEGSYVKVAEKFRAQA